jgi:hypothetical protein
MVEMHRSLANVKKKKRARRKGQDGSYAVHKKRKIAANTTLGLRPK